jgi:AcrR family transcriptional regulator
MMSAAAPSPWPSTQQRKQTREAKHEAVLRTAVRLFNERGFSATSLDDVAARLNVTKPVIYRHFSNKDQILFECARRGLDQILEASAGAQIVSGPALDRLVALMRRYALIMTDDFGMCVIRTGDHELTPASRRKLRAMKRKVGDAICALIEEGVQDGSMAPCDPQMATFAVSGALNWIAKWYDPNGPRSADDVADALTAMATRMVQA